MNNLNSKKDITLLSIETSCDETAAAISINGRTILSNVISTQIDEHKKYGGVVPEVASRKHLENINWVVEASLEQAGKTFQDIDGIGVTYGPGLVGALLVGLATAKAMAYCLGKPLIGVHHIEGHICANYIEHPELKPPFLCLVVSGGHTNLVAVKDYQNYEILGRTRDDAVGEAFDKVARALGLEYPGGPIIDRIAKNGNEKAIEFPRAYLEKDSLDFSFSGIKSSVLNYLNSQKQKKLEISQEDVAASFQKAIMDVIVSKTMMAVEQLKANQVVMAGGVAANSKLRAMMQKACDENQVDLKYPSLKLCTDNAAMIGCAAYYNLKAGKISGLDLNGVPNLKL